MRSLIGPPNPSARLELSKRYNLICGLTSFIAVEQHVAGLLVLEDVPCADLSRLSSDLRAAGITPEHLQKASQVFNVLGRKSELERNVVSMSDALIDQ